MFMAGISGIIPGTNSVAVGAPDGIDPHWESTILLLSGDGTNGSTVLTDESFANRGAINPRGGGNGLRVDTSIKLFGTGSIRGDSGFNDSSTYADHPDWTLGTSDFTIEFFHYFESNTAVQTFASHYSFTSDQRGWLAGYDPSAADILKFTASADGASAANIVTGNFTPTLQTWYYICFERSGNTFRIYTGTPGGNATMLNSASNAIDIFNSTAAFHISGTANIEQEYYGNMDELRITLGVARYADDAGFTVPTAAFPRS